MIVHSPSCALYIPFSAQSFQVDAQLLHTMAITTKSHTITLLKLAARGSNMSGANDEKHQQFRGIIPIKQ
jgi:hypothetical protein